MEPERGGAFQGHAETRRRHIVNYIISGTNRPGSKSLEVSRCIQAFYKELGVDFEIIDLAQIPMGRLTGAEYSAKDQPEELKAYIQKINQAEALTLVCPEYNGSYPGILKYFMDHWSYPESFEYRPVSFIGLGGRFGGLRPVEHLQQVFGYRNAYIFPHRVFISNVWSVVKEGQIEDAFIKDLLKVQAELFLKFVRALKSQGLDANTILEQKRQLEAGQRS